MGAVHLAAYLGDGATTSAPHGYHGGRSGGAGRPADLAVVSLAHPTQATLPRGRA